VTDTHSGSDLAAAVATHEASESRDLPERSGAPDAEAEPHEITVYWRPGCVFCRSLMRTLDRAGVATTDINIWEVDGARAIVRDAANGNETVPTVEIDGRFYVNPSPRQVLTAAGHLIEGGSSGRRWPFSKR